VRVLHLSPGADAGSGIGHYAALFRAALRAEGVTIETLDAEGHAFNSARDLRAYMRAAVEGSSRSVDIIHAELGGAALRQFYGALAVTRANRVPVCLTVHDPPGLVWWPFHLPVIRAHDRVAAALRIGVRPLADWFDRRLLRGADAAFVLSEAGAVALSKSLRRPEQREKVTVLAYPIESPREGFALDDHDGALTIGYFGYWYPGKGVETLLDALAILRSRRVPVRAHLWGTASPTAGLSRGEAYTRHIRNMAEELVLGDHVEFEGFLASSEVTANLQQCDAIVLPYGPFPSSPVKSTSAAMYDALASGTPVVAADVKALAEVIRDGENGMLVRSGDSGSLADALERLSTDVRLRRRLRAGARETAQRFSPERAAKTAITVYEAILADRRSRNA
jgi:glycosyltransferase involved in cell wall biosynthesis